MASINIMIDTLCAAIKQDVAINAWSQVEYDKKVQVAENWDPLNDPQQADCPLVILYPTGKSGGLSQEKKIHGLGISSGVYETGKPESISGVTRFKGCRNAEALRVLVVDVLKANIPRGTHIEAIFTEYLPVEDWPFVTANMDITIIEEKLIGFDPFE